VEAALKSETVKEILLRFIAGGVVVSVFALIGDLLKPKTFAGLFGAAPSVALATLVLTVMKNGKDYGSVEARSMMLGAVAFLVYAALISHLMLRHNWRVLPVTTLTVALWFIVAFGLYYVLNYVLAFNA
jgi:hypothetical protein